ncbi:MAG: hypothetical protein RIK87_28660 [Fuerstiella sp.]
MSPHRFPLSVVVFCCTALPVTSLPADEGGVVRVFILAGQSNMEGKASNELLEHQAVDPKTSHLFSHPNRCAD